MTNRRKPQHLKRRQYSLSLPAWYQPLLAIVDKSSNSNALAKLVTHAIRSGALHTLAPGLPSHLTDPGDLAAYLMATTGQPHNAAPTQPLAETTTAREAFATWDDPEPTQHTVAAILDQASAANQHKPALLYVSTPVSPGPTIWDKPADQLTDADLRELQRQAEASFLLNRPS